MGLGLAGLPGEGEDGEAASGRRGGDLRLPGTPQFVCKCKSSRPPGIVRPAGSSSVPGLNLLGEFPENSNGRHRCN